MDILVQLSTKRQAFTISSLSMILIIGFCKYISFFFYFGVKYLKEKWMLVRNTSLFQMFLSRKRCSVSITSCFSVLVCSFCHRNGGVTYLEEFSRLVPLSCPLYLPLGGPLFLFRFQSFNNRHICLDQGFGQQSQPVDSQSKLRPPAWPFTITKLIF